MTPTWWKIRSSEPSFIPDVEVPYGVAGIHEARFLSILVNELVDRHIKFGVVSRLEVGDASRWNTESSQHCNTTQS